MYEGILHVALVLNHMVYGGATLTRQGLLRVDTLLPEFYDERYQNARYT